MKFKKLDVIGVQVVSYTRQDGTPVNGVRLYGTYSLPGVQGLACDSVYVSSSRISSVPSIGDTVYVCYDERGYVRSVTDSI